MAKQHRELAELRTAREIDEASRGKRATDPTRDQCLAVAPGKCDREAAAHDVLRDDREIFGGPAARMESRARVHADEALRHESMAPEQRLAFRKLVVVERKFEAIARAGQAEKIGERDAAMNFRPAFGPRQKAHRVRTASSRRVEAGAGFRAQRCNDRVREFTAAMHLDREVVANCLRLAEKARERCDIRLALGQPRKPGELDETIDETRESRHECLRPRQPDQRDLGIGKTASHRAKRWDRAEQVAELQCAKHRDPARHVAALHRFNRAHLRDRASPGHTNGTRKCSAPRVLQYTEIHGISSEVTTISATCRGEWLVSARRREANAAVMPSHAAALASASGHRPANALTSAQRPAATAP
jgi:hypothetical protein